MTKILWSLP